MYIEYMAHANNHRGNQIVENLEGFSKCVSERHGAQTNTL